MKSTRLQSQYGTGRRVTKFLCVALFFFRDPQLIWRGRVKQGDEHDDVQSFMFLSDKYILFAHAVPYEENAALSVMELTGEF